MKIAYFVHDLTDAAVHRRVRMLRAFADVILIGFRRSDASVSPYPDIDTIDLGRTVDAQLGQRAISVLLAAATISRWQQRLVGITLFVARQLEMLVLARLARGRMATTAPLVFECLDIHRLMLTQQPLGAALRSLERHLLRSCSMLVVSSPAFMTNHFAKYTPAPPAHLLLENKVLADDVPPSVLAHIDQLRSSGPTVGPPWRIGWFGVIRCRRSLELLADLVRRMPGLVEVVIRGRPRRNVVPDFDELVSTTPGLEFLGEYDRHSQLATIYGDVHFVWAMDFYETGGNSDWLLPNRLYEGTLFGAVPLVLRSVETGQWLERRHCGVGLDDTASFRLEQSLPEFFRCLSVDVYVTARHRIAQLPLSDLLDDQAACDRYGTIFRTLRPRHTA